MSKEITLQNRSIPITYDYAEAAEQKKGMSKKTKLLIAGLTLGALGIGTYAYFQWRGKDKAAKRSGGSAAPFDNGSGQEEKNDPPPGVKSAAPAPGSTPPSSAPKKPASDFPIKKGSRGEKVRALQQALISKFGATILPKYGADGQYGTELEKALKAKGVPTVIDEATWKILTQVDTTDLATKLYNAAKSRNFPDTVAALKQIRSPQDYKMVSEQIKSKPNMTKFSNNSLVNTLFEVFTSADQKQTLQLEFHRMKLVHDGTKWTIPETVDGIEAKQIIAARPTKVWIKASHPVNVGANTILGNEVVSGNGITMFDTVDGFRMYVMTSHVRYL